MNKMLAMVTEQATLVERFKQLGNLLCELAAAAEEAVEPAADAEAPVASVWTPIDPGERQSVLREHAKQQRLERLRAVMDEAGRLVIDAFRSQLLKQDELAELVAHLDLKRPGNLVTSPANLFRLLVGGPCIDLEIEGKGVRLQRPRTDWLVPFDLPETTQSVRQNERSMAAAVSKLLVGRTSEKHLEIHPGQCRLYAKACMVLAGILEPQKLPPRAQSALLQYDYARDAKGSALTDEQAYNLLKKAYEQEPDVKEKLGPLQSFDTWTRYLREGRSFSGDQKHKRRKRGKGDSKSIVSKSEI